MKIVDIADDQPISDANVKIGGHIHYYRYRYFTLENLEDTLYLEHANYRFEALPLSHYHYIIGSNSEYIITVYGYPEAKQIITLEAPFAKSSKQKNDSIDFEVFYPEKNALIEMNSRNGEKSILKLKASSSYDYQVKNGSTPKYKYTARLKYDDVQHGYITLPDNDEFDTIIIRNWWEPLYLLKNGAKEMKTRELDLLKKYFSQIENAQIERREIRIQHEYELVDLKSKIDSLQVEIDRLNGISIDEPLEYLEYPVEQIEAEIIDFPSISANFPGGIHALKHDLLKRLSIRSVRYSGNITLELMIEKDGSVKLKFLHISPAMDEVKDALVGFSTVRWLPAEHSGRRIREKVILLINLSER
ncbi:MAG: hypothetical protein ACI837_003467 [Crocinitomicaceae bacterium]